MRELDLCLNPIEHLPADMEALKRLEVFLIDEWRLRPPFEPLAPRPWR